MKITADFPVLQTERLLLRELIFTDAKNIFEVFSDPMVTQYYGLETFTDVEDAEQFIHSLDEGYEKGQCIRWGIVLQETGKLIGTCGFHAWSKTHRRTELGYELNREFWGMGYMSEVLQAILTYAHEELGFHRIGATIRPENKESIALVEKFGFQQDGLLRDYQRTSKGYFPLYMYSLINTQEN
jgi:ribosomal-protein-alanine N-acetyltransferase